MKKIYMAVMMMMFALVLTGCSYSTVPPATLGKILSGSGYSTDVKQPGKHVVWWWENLVTLDTSTQTVSEVITVKMKDNLDMRFTVRFRTRLGGDDKTINAMFNDIRHEKYKVSLGMVYGVYGKDVVHNIGRSVMSKYNAGEVPQNYDLITQELHERLKERLKDSPLEVSNVTLADVVYPKVITDAIESQQERLLAIETEENQQAIEMVKRTNELALVNAEYEIRMKRAQAIRDENEITSKGLSPALIEYRRIEAMEKISQNGNVIFYPYEANGTSGLTNRIYSK